MAKKVKHNLSEVYLRSLIEEEKKFAEIEKEFLIETTYRSPQIDVDELIKNGYISAEDYRKTHQ